MPRFKVLLKFKHLNNWSKIVEIEAKSKRKAIIKAEKAFPLSKADDNLTTEIHQ